MVTQKLNMRKECLLMIIGGNLFIKSKIILLWHRKCWKRQFLFSLEIRPCLVMFACLHAESQLSSIKTQIQRWLTWWKAPLHLSTSLTPSSRGSNEMQIIASDIRVCRTCCNPTTERSISTATDSQTRQAGTDSRGKTRRVWQRNQILMPETEPTLGTLNHSILWD